MTTLTLYLSKPAAKYFRYYNDGVGKELEVSGLFRDIIIIFAKNRWNKDMKMYEKGEYDPELTEEILIKVTERDKPTTHDLRFNMWIHPRKMKLMNTFFIRQIHHEINLTVDCHLQAQGNITNAILSVLGKYDIDETLEMNIHSILKSNLRYRLKYGTGTVVKKRVKYGTGDISNKKVKNELN